jgi:tRNA(Ile)-lysidine synthase
VIEARPLARWRARSRVLTELEAPVVVGCSGGADSTALLAFAAASGLEPVAVHVDHGLRPGSERERDHVEALAERLGTGFRACSVVVPPGANLEARARDERYRALEDARVDVGATAILVGHTLDDQAETVLLNLLRGSGSAGLAGMAARRGRIVRPLLAIRRDETRALCEELGLEPVEDPSNHDHAFRRAWVRHELLPMLNAGAARDLAPVLARQADVLRDESEFLDELARAQWPNAAGCRSVDLARLPRPIARRAVRCWIGSPPPSFAEVESVLAIAHGDGVAVDLAGGRRVARRDGMMRVEHATSVTVPSNAAEVRV